MGQWRRDRMTVRGGSERDTGAGQRKSASPWRKWRPRKAPVKAAMSGSNAAIQRRALNKMSVIQMECGITEAEHDAWHAEQRRRVFERYGIER